MTKKISASSYYDYRRIDAYNGVYNFILGGRGIGKTFGAIKKEIKAGIKTGSQFVYARRYIDEIKQTKTTFFDAVIRAGLFPEAEFRVNGNVGEWAPAVPSDIESWSKADQKEWFKKREWQVLVYFVALSGGQKLKSKPYPLVKTIIYDEFILEKGLTRYLDGETSVMLNLYNTVDRQEDRVKVYFLANAVSIDNPFFVHYEISPDDVRKEFVVKYDGFMVCHFPESEAFKNEVIKTRFGRFLLESDPDYFEFAHGNHFRDNTKLQVAKKDSKAEYLFTLETEKGTFSIWNKMGSPIFYAQRKLPKDDVVYTLMPERAGAKKQYVDVKDKMVAVLRSAWRRNDLYFDADITRIAFLEVFKK